MGFWLISFLFLSLSEPHQGQQSPHFVSREEPGQMGTAWKLPVTPANRAGQNQLYGIKNGGIQRLSCSHSISGVLENGKFKPGAHVPGEVTAVSLASIAEPSSN